MDAGTDFTDLVRRCHDRLVRWLAVSTKDLSLAEDIAQMTYEKLWRSRDRVDRWNAGLLFVAARRVLIDHVRRPHVQAVSWDAAADGRMEMSSEDVVVLRAEIAEEIGRLTDTVRPVVLLTVAGYRMQEIADLLGVPMGTVKSRLNYARGIQAQGRVPRGRRRRPA